MKTFKGRTGKFPTRAWKLSSLWALFMDQLFVVSRLVYPLAAWKMACLATDSSMWNRSTMAQSVALVGTDRLNTLLQPSAKLLVQ